MLRILLVDDNAELRETLLLLMEAPDREIAICGSAEEALQLFEATPFDLVLSDVQLPNLSGLELARRLRARSPHPWIVLTSGARPQLPDDPVGRTVFLAKPFDMEALEALLGRAGSASR